MYFPWLIFSFSVNPKCNGAFIDNYFYFMGRYYHDAGGYYSKPDGKEYCKGHNASQPLFTTETEHRATFMLKSKFSLQVIGCTGYNDSIIRVSID